MADLTGNLDTTLQSAILNAFAVFPTTGNLAKTLDAVTVVSVARPIVTQTVTEVATFVTREPRSSVAFNLRDIAGPLSDNPTSVTKFSRLETAILNDSWTTSSYPSFVEQVLISGTASIAIKRNAVVTETAKFLSRALGSRRLGESVRETAQIHSNFAYNNDVTLRDSAVFTTNTYPIKRSRPVLRETAKVRGGSSLPAGINVREVVSVTSRTTSRVVGRFVLREVAHLSDAHQLYLRTTSIFTEAASLSSNTYFTQAHRPEVLEVFYSSDDVVTPVTLNSLGSGYNNNNNSGVSGDNGEGTGGTKIAYTCSIATWGMSILTDGTGSFITTNITDLGASRFKRPSAVYVNGMVTAIPDNAEGLEGQLTVTISGDSDGAPAVGKYPLELRDQTDYRNNRVLIGKGFRSRYLQLKIGGTDVDFQLTSAEIDVAVSNRRV